MVILAFAFMTLRSLSRYVPLADNDILVCGIALGHEDRAAPENSMETPREPVANFASFHGLDERETTPQAHS
jgi:hypothetical protein